MSHTMMGKRAYYRYEDIEEDFGGVDEIDPENESIEEYSSASSCSHEEWLSTIAEETSFDLRTRQTLDSLSLASYFDDSVDADDEEFEYLRGIQRQIEVLKERLERFTSMGDNENLDSAREDGYLDEGFERPPMQRQRSNQSQNSHSTDKELWKASQSTPTTWDISSQSDSYSTDASPKDVDAPDFAMIINESERIDPVSIASSRKGSQMEHPSLPQMDGNSSAKASSSQLRWIGTNIEFLVATDALAAPDSVSLFEASAQAGNIASSVELDTGRKLHIPTSIRENHGHWTAIWGPPS